MPVSKNHKPLHEKDKFWDVLATHHAAIEDNYLDLASLRRIIDEVRSPVLVIGAGQGLLVEELQSKGFHCDGVDFSAEMVRYARSRRGLNLIQAEASAIPLGDASYESIIYATGVVDFNGDEQAIRGMLSEGRRVVKPRGKIFVAFYRFSPALEDFLARVGLLSDNVLLHRRSLETYLLKPAQLVQWVMKNAGTSWPGAVALMLRMAALGAVREKTTTLRMQRIFRNMEHPEAFIMAAPETQPYRNEAEIRRLFDRLGASIKEFRTLASCWIVQI
jgi:SAM-dependent methyltransferase